MSTSYQTSTETTRTTTGSAGTDTLGRRRRSPNGSVNHSQNYRCRHVGADGIRTHDEWATARHRIGVKLIPLCEAHGTAWRTQRIVAPRRGEHGVNRVPVPTPWWDRLSRTPESCRPGDQSPSSAAACRTAPASHLEGSA